MSDGKPRRVARESARRETPSEEIPAAAVPPFDAAPPQPSIAAPTEAAISQPAPASVAAPEPVMAVMPPQPTIAPAAAVTAVEAEAAPADDAWAALLEAHAALARGLEEIAGEVSGLSRSGIAAAADAAVALIGAKTFAEAVEINAALARHGVDAMIEGSAKLSEIGVKAMTDASRPILSRLGAAWSGAGAG
jgi:hypothetical protein